ncbi:unnamed protein product [Phytophthora lilii]|uniref:Unnamed protein product n=1 Tax=Phytophthora lilii TaxID=2077276 RepID=A0A9W6X6R6_9STRA|nr:unnamed protein product [Phytophthora lilii]
MIARIASNDEDSIPAVVVFSVDVFNGLYTSICMQSSGTWWASFLMITFNATNTVLSVLEINRAARIFNELNRTSDAPSRRKQVWNSIAPVANTRRNRSSNLHRSAKQTASAMSISGNAIASYSSRLSLTTNKLRVPAKLLFYLEYRALVGYIEAAIPLMYAVYLSILVNLPSAKYYPHARALTPKQLETTIGSIIACSSTEMLSLVWLHVVVRRKFGFSLLY